VANAFQNIRLVTYEALDILQPNMAFGNAVDKSYSSDFGDEGYQVGDTIYIRLPQQYLGRTGAAISLENLTDRTTPLTITTQYGVDFAITSKERALNIENLRGRYLEPGFVTVASKVDRDGLLMAALTVPNFVGTPGTAPTDDTIRAATVVLDENDAPTDANRWLMIPSRMESQVLTATKVQFNDQAELGRQYMRGRMGRALGYDWVMTQNLPRLTTGNYGGTPVIAGAGQTGSTLALSGFTAGATFNAGDRFTVAGTFNVENVGKVPMASLKQFLITTAATANGSGAVTLNISPAISPTGQYQNVSNSPANGAAVTMVGAANTNYSIGLAFHKTAFTLAFVPLNMPSGSVDMKFQIPSESGQVPIRALSQYQISTDQEIFRTDVLYGYGVLQAEKAVIIYGN
jgi:uncharacterized protein affecting Mg2+/Co2+ transport